MRFGTPWSAGRASTGRRETLLLVLAGLCLCVPAAQAQQHFVWIDEAGVTHITDDPEAVPEGHRGTATGDWDRTRHLWDDGIRGPLTGTPPGASGREADQIRRLLRGAVHDLRRGETSRASRTFRIT